MANTEINVMGTKELEDVLVLVRDAVKAVKELFAKGDASFKNVAGIAIALFSEVRAAVEGFDKVDDEVKDLIEAEFTKLMNDYGTPMLWQVASKLLAK
jgi:hypothetical protein